MDFAVKAVIDLVLVPAREDRSEIVMEATVEVVIDIFTMIAVGLRSLARGGISTTVSMTKWS